MGLDRVQQRFEEQDLEVPRVSLVQSDAVWWRRSPTWTSCSRSRTETCTVFLRALLLLFATVFGGFWKNFVRFSYVKVFSDPEVDSPLHLRIWIFNEPLVSDSHLPWSCQAFGRISRIFYVKADSDPEGQSDCTRDKVFMWRWRRLLFFWRNVRHFSDSSSRS